MEQLRAELSHLLGEKLSRVECVNEKADTALWSLYDSHGHPMPLLARSFTTPGLARQLAWKMSMLARSGTVRMPVVYGVMTHDEHPGPDVLLIERLRGVPVEAPARTPERWEQLKDQIVEALLAWHRQDSHGCVGVVDSTQENIWPSWYRQRVEVLWNTLNQFKNTGLTMQDKRILFRTRECLPKLFEGFNDNCAPRWRPPTIRPRPCTRCWSWMPMAHSLQPSWCSCWGWRNPASAACWPSCRPPAR